MASCGVSCTVTVPTYPNAGCDVVTRPAGAKKLVFMACDQTFANITDLEEWADKIAANKLHASGECNISKPKGSLTKKKLVSCRPEQVTGGTRTLNFTDPNADNETFGEYTFWNFIQQNQNKLVFGYVTCDDLFYGFKPTGGTGTAGDLTQFAIDLDDTRVEDSNENAQIEGTITWLDKLMSKPVSIPGLSAALA